MHYFDSRNRRTETWRFSDKNVLNKFNFQYYEQKSNFRP